MTTQQLAMPKPSSEPTVKGPEMNDRDRINDILATEKYLSMSYNIGVHEMQNPQLHQTVRQVLNDVNDIHWDMFNAMFQRGWYKMTVADGQEVQKTAKQFSNYSSQFPV